MERNVVPGRYDNLWECFVLELHKLQLGLLPGEAKQ